MSKKIIAIIFGVLLIGIGAGYANPDFADVQTKTIPVTESVYMIQGAGGNIGVSVGEDGVIMVDDDFAPLADKIHKSLEELSKSNIKFVLNTHWHGDHTGGNEEFGREATIIAHDNVRDRLSTKQVIELFNMVSEPKSKEGLPVITFKESVSIHFNKERIDVIHFATGHTDGDSVIFFRGSNVVHAGDHFFNGFYPFIDLVSGGNVQGFINNVEELIGMIPQDAKIIPGHGPLANLEDLKGFHKMLLDSTDIVKKALREGKNLEEIKKKSLSKELVDKWGKGILTTDQWIEIIYNSYSQ